MQIDGDEIMTAIMTSLPLQRPPHKDKTATGFDERAIAAFKDAMANLAAPVSVITSADADGAYAATVSSIASLSLSPPQTFFALSEKSALLQKLKETKRCGINLLATDQSDIAHACAKRGPGKLDDVTFRYDHGLPRLDGTLAWLRCEIERFISSGDHEIIVASPIEISVENGDPCVYFRRQFHTVRATGEGVADLDDTLLTAVCF